MALGLDVCNVELVEASKHSREVIKELNEHTQLKLRKQENGFKLLEQIYKFKVFQNKQKAQKSS